MPKATIILSLLLLSLITRAQVVFKTIVQTQSVEAGKSFSVEYLLEVVEGDDGFTQPFFNGFRLISGPNIYNGSIKDPDGTIKTVKNFVFTLVAVKPGKLIIPGAAAKVNGRFIRSDDIEIEVTEKSEKTGNSSEYFLQPGEDPYEKIRRNLFMKVMVNKRSCYIGEPVIATFKLYSRLQSKSDIVKNPGFYGFSVQDIISLDDRISNTETIGGRTFDVHTIRTVQLYPLQAGLFMIDPMEVMNKVEFSKSRVSKMTEQEISEGVHENINESSSGDYNTVTYENNLSTEKIAISVKPYPEKNKPPAFSGATGNFTISAGLENNDLAKNEEGDLVVTISGKGNFTQLSAPVIQWPGGIEGFEAVIKDTLDKTHTPLKGTRTFRFPFVAADAGIYNVPAVSFTFFDTDSNKYKTVSAKPLEIKISEREKKGLTITKKTKDKKTGMAVLWWAGGGVLIVSIAAAWWFKYKRKQVKVAALKDEKKLYPVTEEVLKPACIAMEKNDSRFYAILQKAIWDYLAAILGLSGSRLNKLDLQKALKTTSLSPDQADHILGILQECEAAAFTKAEFIHDKKELLNRTKALLDKVQA